MIAAAIPSLCFIPREYFLNVRLSSGSSPTFSSVRRMSSSSILFFIEARSLRFLKPVYPSINEGFSSRTPILSGKDISFPRSSSLIYIFPSVGMISPHTALISIVFPAPFFPLKPYILPPCISIFISSNICLFLILFDK